MNDKTVKRISHIISQSLSMPWDILGKMYNLAMYEMVDSEPDGDYAGERQQLEESLKFSLERAARQIAIYLEVLGLTKSRAAFLSKWQSFEGKLTVVENVQTEGGEELESTSLNYLYELNSMIAALANSEVGPRRALGDDSGGLKRLEYVLGCTAQVLRNMGVDRPSREQDVASAMNKHLRTVFDDYITDVKIPKPITGFKPDGGVRSLQAAIEFKFCDSDKKVKTAVRGVTEDLSGYSGSRDWVRFYSVFYLTEAFTNRKEVHRSLSLSGNVRKWKTFVVIGGHRNSDE